MTRAPESPPEFDAAIRRWTTIAAYAWDQYLALGRGIVVADHDQFMAAKEGELELSYVPADYIQKSDDYRPLVLAYDPAHEVLLVLARAGGDDQLLRLRPRDDDCPAPESCWRQSNHAPNED